MENGEQRAAWVIKRQLNADALKEYVARFNICRTQVVAVTEPHDGMFTLIYEPTDVQQTQLEAEEEQVAETLDTLFGAPVTPSLSGAEGAVVAVPVVTPSAPEPGSPVVPSTEPSPS